MGNKKRYKIIPVVNKEVDFDNVSNQIVREKGTENYSYIHETPDIGNSNSLRTLWVKVTTKRYEAIELYVVQDRKPEPTEWGIGHATGIKIPGEGYKGRGHFLFHHDGKIGGTLNSNCVGSQAVVASTLELEDWSDETYFPQISEEFKELYAKLGEAIEEVSLIIEDGKIVTDGNMVIIEPSQANWDRNELLEVLRKFEKEGVSPEEFLERI